MLDQLRGVLRPPGMADLVTRAVKLDRTLDEAPVAVAMTRLDRNQLLPAEQQRIVRLLVERVIVSRKDIAVRLHAHGIEWLNL